MPEPTVIDDIKKNCKFCFTYKTFHEKNSENYKNNVLKDLDFVVGELNKEYDSLRRG